MKKRLLLFTTFLFTIFFITACSTKTPLNSNDFVDLIEQNEYKTTNVINQFTDYTQIKNAFIAQDKGMNYQIEYYELDTIDSAKSFYKGNKEIFQKQENIKSHTKVDLDNYEKYTQSTDTVYSSISRIDNTVVYANVKIEYKDKIIEIIKKLGY